MEHAHQYVPATTKDVDIEFPTLNEKLSVNVTECHRLLFGGDQLTAKRGRGSQRIRFAESSTKFDEDQGVKSISNYHSTASEAQDLKLLLNELGTHVNPFMQIPNLHHNNIKVPKTTHCSRWIQKSFILGLIRNGVLFLLDFINFMIMIV